MSGNYPLRSLCALSEWNRLSGQIQQSRTRQEGTGEGVNVREAVGGEGWVAV